jgi:uncharacterized protein DUF1579
MRKAFALAVVVTMSCAAGLFAQAPPQKPGPEHKKLEYFVGKWASTGEIKASPFGPAGKLTSTDACEWFQGGFAVVCDSQGTMPTGPMKGLAVMGYSADQKMYTYYGLDSSAMSMTSVPKGTVEGDTWTYNDESMMGGQTVTSRFVMKILSPDSYTFKWEAVGPDKKWMTIMDGTATRTK